MKFLLILITIAVIAGGGWFYLQGLGTEMAAPGTPAFDQLGVPDSDPTMQMKTISDDSMSADITTKTIPPKTIPVQKPTPEQQIAVNDVVVNVTGANFAFSKKEIRVKKGDKVTVNFESTNGLHDWVVDEFSGARTQQVRPGTKTSTTFKADKTGVFEFYCSVSQHRGMGMVGKLIVE